MARVRTPVAHGHTRLRLHRMLDTVRATGLALVVAPAGSGKTTLLARWARAQSGIVAWYRADASDAGAGPRSALPTIVAAALRVAFVSRLPDGHPSLAGTVDELEDLVALLEAVEEKVVLVVDDVQELAGTGATADLERLLLLAPPNLLVLLGGRVIPEINLSRGEVRSPVIIDGDDLRFRSWEVEELFRDFHREPLLPEDAAVLARRTDGWAVALQLFHLATGGRAAAQRSEAVRSLGPARYAKEYLSAQVLAGLPEELRDLLRRTCVFDTVTADRCERLLGRGGAQQALEELEHRQALTTSDDGGLTFRYHQVLRRYLESALREELGDAGAHDWYRRAADILEADGAVVEALRARCRAADWAGVRRLLHEDGERLAADPTSNWAELLPLWLSRDDPWVALAEARRLLDDGQFHAAERAARRAREQFTQQRGREQCGEVLRTATAWVRGPQEIDARWADLLRAAVQRNPQLQAERARRLGTAMGELVEGLAHFLAGDQARAVTVLRRRAGRPDDDRRAALAARLALAAFSVFERSRAAALRELDAVCAEAELCGYTWLARTGQAIVLVLDGDPARLHAAEELAQDCVARGDLWGALVIGTCVQLAVLRSCAPDLDKLEAFIDFARGMQAGVQEAWARCVQALVFAAEDRPEAEAYARAAESFARTAGATGALAIAYSALALARTEDAAELTELAASTSAEIGLDVQPWRWLRRATDPPPTVARRTAGSTGPIAGPRSLELSCFGPFRLSIGGVVQPLTGARPRARALLRLLALHAGEPVHRERLADALWGELASDAALHNLQVSISTLRRMLTPGEQPRLSLIERDGDAYRLVLGSDARYDVREFDTELSTAARARSAGDPDAAIAALGRALSSYAGDLLPEDGAADWVIDPRERYRTLAVGAAATLAELHLDRGDAESAAGAAARGVHNDPYHHRCWRVLIRAHEAQGDHAAAQRALRGYRDVLDSLGVAAEPVPYR
jgi:DNA-binding SARP family transcriptional activator